MKRGLSIIIRVAIRLLVILVCVFALLILYLTGREYKPADTENLTVESDYAGINPGIRPGTNTRVVIWNIGYGALGESADFFMDYGKMGTLPDPTISTRQSCWVTSIAIMIVPLPITIRLITFPIPYLP